MTLPQKVYIREVGPREGVQILPPLLTTEQKIEFVRLLAATGVPEIEAVSFVRADRIPQMADAEQVIAGLGAVRAKVTGLYLNQRGYERALAHPTLTTRGWIMTAVSDSFLRRNNNCSQEEVIQSLPEWVQRFQEKGTPLYGLMVSTAFGEDAPSSVAELMNVVTPVIRRAAELGAAFEEICLADTVGIGDPIRVRDAIRAVKQESPRSEVALHLHDTRGLALVNAYAGLCEGVTIFDASVGGLGGCPFTAGASGNVATEDLVYLFQQLGIETGVDLDKYLEVIRFLELLKGVALHSRYRLWMKRY